LESEIADLERKAESDAASIQMLTKQMAELTNKSVADATKIRELEAQLASKPQEGPGGSTFATKVRKLEAQLASKPQEGPSSFAPMGMSDSSFSIAEIASHAACIQKLQLDMAEQKIRYDGAQVFKDKRQEFNLNKTVLKWCHEWESGSVNGSVATKMTNGMIHGLCSKSFDNPLFTKVRHTS
jgi:hypothetical protein